MRGSSLSTQLNWRLLEGGYYELGVADSGDLTAFSRDELEQTLVTLEMMEIGACIIVVKEIKVPPALASTAKAVLKGMSSPLLSLFFNRKRLYDKHEHH